MGVPGFLVQLFRQAPNKGQLVRSLALGGKGGNRTATSGDGTELSVRQTGEGDPMVLVHGSLDGIGAFSLVELRLAEDYSVWAYDRRGRGGSGDGAEYSLDREVDDLRAVITATRGVPHVVAHSYGAVIALQSRLLGVPMRSLVVYEPPSTARPSTRSRSPIFNSQSRRAESTMPFATWRIDSQESPTTNWRLP